MQPFPGALFKFKANNTPFPSLEPWVAKQQWRANNARWRAATCNVQLELVLRLWDLALALALAPELARKCTAVRYDCIYMHPISAPASGRVSLPLTGPTPHPPLSGSVCLYRSVCLGAHPRHTPTAATEGTKPGTPKPRPKMHLKKLVIRLSKNYNITFLIFPSSSQIYYI